MNFISTSPVFGARRSTRLIRNAFTMIEILVVISIIGILIALLLPTLNSVRGNGARTISMAHMKQTFMLMQSYAQANRDTVVPSAFDFSDAAGYKDAKGKMKSRGNIRSEKSPPVGDQYKGTWADILWTDAGYGPIANLSIDDTGDGTNVTEYQYRFDNPDDTLYEKLTGYDKTPFRSNLPLLTPYTTYTQPGFDPARPISLDSEIATNKLGGNAILQGVPGLFAANNFFDSRMNLLQKGDAQFSFRTKTNHPYDAMKGPYFTFGEMTRPEVSAYLVDSCAGETIDPVDSTDSGPLSVRPFNCESTTGAVDADTGSATKESLGQVDFRYPGDTCLILLLDGHTRTEAKWASMFELEGGANNLKDDGTLNTGANDPSDQGRGVRFRHLDMR